MKKIFLFQLLAALGLCAGACQKQQSDAERNAEVERQVQQRLEAERQAQEQDELAQRQAELDAREKALAVKEADAAPTAPPVASVTPAARTSDTENSSYATFYRKLDQFGDWMETGDYGYVFQPRVATQSRDWRPYTDGHWVYTDAGWTWISEEKFGWATYHYGRWVRLRSVGWVWVPGEQWAPAWVSWRRGNEFVGWAPLPPEARFDRQIGIRNWADSYYDIGPEQYSFVPANEFGRKLTPRAIVPPQRNVTIINQTINVTNITYDNSIVIDRGPSYDDLKARSRQPIERLRLERTQNLNDERPVIRGEVVALPTADFHPAQREARPDRVVRNIAQPVVEHGWAGIHDAEAAQKARAKMKAEATPPPNLPPRRFVRPGHTVNPPRSVPVNVGQEISPNVQKAKMEPVGTPAPEPSAAPTAPATPSESVQPSPAENIPSLQETGRNRGQKAETKKQRREKQLERRQENRRGHMESATPSPTVSATASVPPSESVSPTPETEASTASPSPASPNEKAKARRKEKRAQGRKGKASAQPESSPSPHAP